MPCHVISDLGDVEARRRQVEVPDMTHQKNPIQKESQTEMNETKGGRDEGTKGGRGGARKKEGRRRREAGVREPREGKDETEETS